MLSDVTRVRMMVIVWVLMDYYDGVSRLHVLS